MKKHTHSNEEPNIISKWLFKYGNEIIRKNTEEKLEKLMKEQEIKEAAEKFYSEQSKAYEDEIKPIFDTSRYLVAGFLDGYKLAKEERYNEEDVDKLINIIQWYDDNSSVRPDSETFTWFEQFKKK